MKDGSDFYVSCVFAIFLMAKFGFWYSGADGKAGYREISRWTLGNCSSSWVMMAELVKKLTQISVYSGCLLHAMC